jgi:ribosomal protein L16 Arg81 hydroxylase
MQTASVNSAAASMAATAAANPPGAFLDTISLKSLVWPVGEEEFRARHWERSPLIVHRADPAYYGDLFTLEDFDRSVMRGRGYVKTAEATAKKQAKHQGTNASVLERLLSDMREGHTLILDGLQDFDPRLGQLCRVLGQEIGARFQTNLYLTPPNGKGFTPHWDNHDVFVLQVMGSKHWKVEKTRRLLPEKDGQIEEEGRELRGDLHSFTLQQGDMVYIPRGFVHAAECGSESSLHITLGIYPSTWDELLTAVIKAATLRDENLRLTLPFGYMKGDEAIANRVVDILRNIATPAFVTEVLQQFREEMVKRGQLDISGQVMSFFQPVPLKLEDKVGPRLGLFHTTRKDAETVTLSIGSRAITFPDFFADALDFALNTPVFTIRDIPGDLEDELKLVFIERLMQEALVIRK